MDSLTRNMERMKSATTSFQSADDSIYTSRSRRSTNISYQSDIPEAPLYEDSPAIMASPKSRVVYDSTSAAPNSIPDDYKKNRASTEPLLYYIPQCPEDASLARLLKAAEDDVRLHQARIQAVLKNDPKLVSSYTFADDAELKARNVRKLERLERLRNLQEGACQILEELDEVKKGLTNEERIQVKLARWQRALHLYVYSPSHLKMDMLGLLEKLLEGLNEEEELSDILSLASEMCLAVQEATVVAVRDASDAAAEAEDAYQIRLEAHALHARRTMLESDKIQNDFRTSGRAALQIGQQLEFAESKRRQCESASILIRRWWMMENLAEQEALSGEEIKVQEEMRGVIPVPKCRMDPLFTNPDRSLEAARALKQLRAVVKARGNAAASGGGGAWAMGSGDVHTTRRFEITAKLVARTSLALEQRLLNTFSEIYSKGGVYDFTEDPRPGSIDWVQLRELAHALLLFDSGRNLHRRFFRNFQPSHEEEEAQDGSFNMKATRSKLSSLFHRVSDVCTAEFELIAHVFGSSAEGGSDEMPMTVARALLQRVISDPRSGLQARINDLLESVDRRGDFDAGAKKLDTFVVIHEKAAGLFSLLKEAAVKNLVPDDADDVEVDRRAIGEDSASSSIDSLKQFLTSQEIALSSSHRRGYLNLELRLLHHDCCATLSAINLTLVKPPPPKTISSGKGDLEEYVAPILPLDKPTLRKELGFTGILSGPLKSSTLRQPLIYATDSLARARLMFGVGKKGGESTADVITAIYSQMCAFYGQAFLFPIVETLGEMLNRHAPANPPTLPFDESAPAHDLGVDPAFWVGLERVHSAAKSFDRELWAENRTGSGRVWEILVTTQAVDSMPVARRCRVNFFSELERRGEAAILRALDTLGAHIHWILVTGGESMSATGGSRIRHHITGAYSGPYSLPSGSALEAPNSPAVKSLTYCLRSQFVNIQAALTPQSLSSFWTALSMRLYDILVTRLLQHYSVSTVGAVILSRDVEALRSVSMLAGSDHAHWDNLRELVTLYMTPPDALKTMLVGPEGDVNSSKGLFKRVGRLQSLVFMSRRVDYRYKTVQGEKKSGWAVELLEEFGVQDPTEGGSINIAMFAAGRK